MPAFHALASKSNAPTAAAALTRLQGGLGEAMRKETLATQGMKRSGMRWRHPGGQAILILRAALIQSRRFEPAWEMLSNLPCRPYPTGQCRRAVASIDQFETYTLLKYVFVLMPYPFYRRYRLAYRKPWFKA